MTAYRATILLLTAGMIVLHLLEWLAVPKVLKASQGGSALSPPIRRLRLAIRLEALYYVVALPTFFWVPDKWVGHLMVVSAAYHWIVFALFEVCFGRKKRAFGRRAAWAIGVLDLAEVVLLISFSRSLYGFAWQ